MSGTPYVQVYVPRERINDPETVHTVDNIHRSGLPHRVCVFDTLPRDLILRDVLGEFNIQHNTVAVVMDSYAWNGYHPDVVSLTEQCPGCGNFTLPLCDAHLITHGITFHPNLQRQIVQMVTDRYDNRKRKRKSRKR